MNNVIPILSTSTPLIHPVLEKVITELFDEMLLDYGQKFVDQWMAAEPDKLRLHWCRNLSGFTPKELKRGIASQKTLDWPPTLPQFKKLCRPSINPETAYYEALEQGVAREYGRENHWSSPAIYWAWRTIGAHDFRSLSYPSLKSRWEKALADEVAKGQWEAVPKTALQLGMNSKTTAMAQRGVQELTKAIEGVVKTSSANVDHRAWVGKLAAKVKNGDASVTPTMARMALDVLRA